ncbi:methyltransferase domain-containing protein [Mycetocola sp. 2940]|uniref:methyltransferase domain-containing protein n=1 Tax=Mycetocola sp. 2940 TaxID=3156452 RepID=UPI0033988CC4
MTLMRAGVRLPLSTRDDALVERMDEASCDREALFRTYAAFPHVNRVVAGWWTTYVRQIRPRFTGPVHTVLDIGSGGGDVARALLRWARRDGVRLEVTAIDPDPRAFDYVETLPPAAGFAHRVCSSTELADEGAQFDFVLSNHVLHHLSAAELGAVLADSERLARVAVVHSDIRRSVAAYLLFSAFAAARFRGSFIREDGLMSIRRSYMLGELIALAPPGWTVSAQVPFRLLLLRDPD